jgi:predicted Zn-dependent peptidase
LLGGLETADGKASTIGFYEAVLGRPAAAFERLEATRRLTQSDLLRAARRYLDPNRRSLIIVRPEPAKAEAEAAE